MTQSGGQQKFRQDDPRVVAAFASGATAEQVAEIAHVSRRTAERWQTAPDVVRAVEEARAATMRSVVAALASELRRSVEVLAELRDTAESEQVRRGAARDLVTLYGPLEAHIDLADRLAAVEAAQDAAPRPT